MERKLARATRFASALFAISAMLVGCTTTPTVTNETSHDGLVKVTKTGFDQAWVRKGLDLTPYKKVMLEGVGIEYRPVKCKSRSLAASSDTEFCLDDGQKERLREIVRKAFVTEMGKSKQFTLTTTAGPDVLLIRGALLDVVSFVPPQPIGRTDVFLAAVGEATLVFEVRDSVSGAILARVADRRAAEAGGNMPTRSNSVSNAYDAELTARSWAAVLRQRLDNAMSLNEAPSA